MKRIASLSLVATFLLSAACHNKGTFSLLGEMQKDYDSIIAFFPKDLVDIFPSMVDENVTSLTGFLKSNPGNFEIIFIKKITNGNDNIDILKFFEDTSLASYKPNDSCLLIVNRFINRDNYYSKKSFESEEQRIVNRNTCEGSLPIPNFWHNPYTTEETSCKLPDDFKIFVLNAKPGKLLDSVYLPQREYMPPEWKNGFSNGVAISSEKQVIIYWLVVW